MSGPGFGRPSSLKAEHAQLVREVRDANPGLGLGRLAPCVAQRLGLHALSESALYRFMRKHGIECLGYVARPTVRVAQGIAEQALEVARARQQPLSSAWPAEFDRAVFVGDVCAAFHALLFVWAQEVGTPHVGQVAQASREWLAEVPQ